MLIEKIQIVLKNIKPRKLMIQFGVLLIIIYTIRSCQQVGMVEGMAPMIKDRLLSGELVELKQYRGKPVLIYFWATWCPICKLVNNNIHRIAKDHAVITIAYWPESENEVKQMLQSENLMMPVIVDMDGEWGKLYGVRGVPSSFILGPQGVIQFSEVGYTTEMGLRFRLWWAGK